jgi:hypothetical protein
VVHVHCGTHLYFFASCPTFANAVAVTARDRVLTARRDPNHFRAGHCHFSDGVLRCHRRDLLELYGRRVA